MCAEFEDTKEIIRIRKSKKNRQHNGQQKKDKRTNNDLQNLTHKNKNRVTRTPLITEMNSGTPCLNFHIFSIRRSVIVHVDLMWNILDI